MKVVYVLFFVFDSELSARSAWVYILPLVDCDVMHDM